MQETKTEKSKGIYSLIEEIEEVYAKQEKDKIHCKEFQYSVELKLIGKVTP